MRDKSNTTQLPNNNINKGKYHRMNVFTGILFITVGYFLCAKVLFADSNIDEAVLQSVLQKYCIPPDEYNCNPTGLAHYDKATDTCIADVDGYGWDAESRTARILVECPDGYGRNFWPIEDILSYKCPNGGEGLQTQDYTITNTNK